MRFNIKRISGILLIVLLAGTSIQAETYVFGSTLDNWFAAGLVPADNANCLKTITSVTGYLHVEAINWGGSNYPVPAAGNWAGARWIAPPGEVVTQVRMTGYFRRQTSSTTDFCAGIYGKARSVSTYTQLANITSSNGTIPGNVQYDQTIMVNQSSNISTLEFRAWQAVAGNQQIAAANAGYSGNINVIEITTVPVTLSDAIILGDTSVRLTMTRQGEVVSMEDLVTGTQILKPNVFPAMRINPFDRSVSLDPLTSLNYTVPTVTTATNEVRFTWSKSGYPTLVGKAAFDPVKGQFLFSTTVTNNYSSYTVSESAFPAALAFDDAAGNYLAICSDQNFNSPLKPLNTLDAFTVMYPAYMYMQMAGFKIGNSSALVYTNDANAQVKWFDFEHPGNTVKLTLQQRVWLRPGQTWNAPYSVVIKPIPNGTYNELAAEYAAWGRAQPWAAIKLTDKIARTPLLNRYFQNGLIRMNAGPPYCTGNTTTQGDPNYTFYQTLPDTLWHYNLNNIYSQYEPYYDSVISAIAQYEAAYGIKPGWWYPTWSGYQFDSPYPDYFPVASYMGDFDTFHQNVIQHGSPIMYHMNIVHWPSATPTAQNYSAYWAVTDQGYYYRNYPSLHFPWSNMDGLLTSPGVSLPIEMATVNRLKDTAGVNGIYLDEFAAAFATDDNQNCEFYDQPNAYQLEKLKAIQTIRAAVTGPIMTETRNEIFLPYMDMGTGGNGGPDVDQIPLWEMVYGDCVSTTTFAGGSDKRQWYYTWMLGGVQNMGQEWPTVGGNNIDTYLISTQQKVVSHVIPERMTRFDLFGNARMSQWPSGLVAWNRQTSGSPINISTATTLGAVTINQLATGGIAILTNSEDFCADSVNSIVKEGVTVFSNQSLLPLSVARSGVRWLIYNENTQSVSVDLRLAKSFWSSHPLEGKFITSGATLRVVAVDQGDVNSLRMTIPAGEAVVLDELVDPVLTVGPVSRPVGYQAGTTTFTVSNSGSGTMNWSAQVIDGGWLSIASGAGGIDGGKITVSFAQNPDSVNSRTGKIRITADGVSGSPKDVTVIQSKGGIPGDANNDGRVDVSDLGVLAANYGKTTGATWTQGDFNGDGRVDVSDLGILAANYGKGTSGNVDFKADYAKVFGTTEDKSTSPTDKTTDEKVDSSVCSGLGLPLISGLFLAGLLLVKMKE